MLSYVPKRVSVLVCFDGKNHRIEIDPKKCVTNPNKDFSYSTTYTSDNGKKYRVLIASIENTNGSKANVVIKSLRSDKVIAERRRVEVRFYRYITEKC